MRTLLLIVVALVSSVAVADQCNNLERRLEKIDESLAKTEEKNVIGREKLLARQLKQLEKYDTRAQEKIDKLQNKRTALIEACASPSPTPTPSSSNS